MYIVILLIIILVCILFFGVIYLHNFLKIWRMRHHVGKSKDVL